MLIGHSSISIKSYSRMPVPACGALRPTGVMLEGGRGQLTCGLQPRMHCSAHGIAASACLHRCQAPAMLHAAPARLASLPALPAQHTGGHDPRPWTRARAAPDAARRWLRSRAARAARSALKLARPCRPRSLATTTASASAIGSGGPAARPSPPRPAAPAATPYCSCTRTSSAPRACSSCALGARAPSAWACADTACRLVVMAQQSPACLQLFRSGSKPGCRTQVRGLCKMGLAIGLVGVRGRARVQAARGPVAHRGARFQQAARHGDLQRLGRQPELQQHAVQRHKVQALVQGYLRPGMCDSCCSAAQKHQLCVFPCQSVACS